LKLLDATGVNYTLIEHPPVPSVKEMHDELKKAGVADMERVVKTLVLKHKKTGDVYLAVVRSTLEMDIQKVLCKNLGLGSGNLRNCDADVIFEKLGAKPGHINPLAVCNDTEHTVKLIIDKGLAVPGALLFCHPMENNKTVSMTWEDYEKFFDTVGAAPRVVDFDGAAAPAPAPAKGKQGKGKQGGGKQGGKQAEEGGAKKDTRLCIEVAKAEDFPKWYQEVIKKSEMIEFYDVSGCYILRPWSYYIWECVQHWFDAQIKESGVQNCYFPCFVSEDKLNKEKDHVEGFQPEVAWVTRSGNSEMAQPIAIRPTSETIMYPAFSDWITSHRDLPMRLNQWCNVVRWEFKNPTPFLRTREFLWQEGHSAFATKEEADKEVLEILGYYERIYTDLLAVPVIPGRKTEKEKFPGGLYTTTVEGYIPSANRAIQGATSHCLGQNFSEMFDITFLNSKSERQKVWQNSWGCTTRTLGVMVMIHSDDKGLVLPPRVSPIHVVIVPIPPKKDKSEDEAAAAAKLQSIMQKADEIYAQLKQAGIKVKVDDRTNYNPGWKFNAWELKGVPLRFELGLMDLEKGHVTAARRVDVMKEGVKKRTIPFGADLATNTVEMLEEIQHEMLSNATAERDSRLSQVTKWSEFLPALDKGHMVLVPFCGDEDAEEWIKENSAIEDPITGQSAGAKSLCIPFNQPSNISDESMPCITGQGRKAKFWTLFGRSY
jgi:prolyl-tRNA synthetase